MARLKPHFTTAKRSGDFVFISGQLPFDDDGNIVSGGIEAQTRRCLENIRAAAATLGLGLEDVVRVGVWLTEAADFPVFDRVYASYFPGEPPARTTVGAVLMVPGALIEMDAQCQVS